MPVNLPLTGAGGTTARVATEQIGGEEYQYFKLTGASASTAAASVLGTTPGAADNALVVRPIGSTAFSQAAVLTAGSSGNIIGSVTNAAGSSAVMMGGVAVSSGNALYLGSGTSGTFQFMQTIPFSTGNVARSSVSTTVDVQLIAANSNRKALVIASRSTAVTIGIGFSTAVLTTGLANVDLYLAPSSVLSFGLQGGLPLYLGPLRGLTISSTTVAASVAVTEFT